MPLYFFGLPDDLASPEAGEELANDAEARHVAQIVASELSRNRYEAGKWRCWCSIIVAGESIRFGRGPRMPRRGRRNHSLQNTSIQKEFTQSDLRRQ